MSMIWLWAAGCFTAFMLVALLTAGSPNADGAVVLMGTLNATALFSIAASIREHTKAQSRGEG